MSDPLVIAVGLLQLAVGAYIGWNVGVVDGRRRERGDVRCDRPLCPRWATSVFRSIEERSPTMTVTTLVYARCPWHESIEALSEAHRG
jgi:hypothetical protein